MGDCKGECGCDRSDILGARKFLIPFAIVLVLLMAVTAFAVPLEALGASVGPDNVTVTISPGVTNCDTLGKEFTVTVKNELTNVHGVYEVRVYRSDTGIDANSFVCGSAPVGWTLSDYAGGDPNLEDYGYCEYKTRMTGAYVITPGTSLDFKFKATMIKSDACESVFTISSLDNGQPIGDHEWDNPQVLIDCTQPVVDKKLGTPYFNLDGDDYITQNTMIAVTSSDMEKCDLGVNNCTVYYTVNGVEQKPMVKEGEEALAFEFNFEQDSRHDVNLVCVDNAGNSTTIKETDFVETVPPETTKTYGKPFYEVDGTLHYITSATPIDFNAVDPSPHPSGVKDLNYRVTLIDDSVCFRGCTDVEGKGDWITTTPNTTITIAEQSCHLIEFQSVDNLGNLENLKHQCVFVDNTDPLLTKEIGTPSIIGADVNWVRQDTPITLTCEDQQPHPSGDVTISWQITLDGNLGEVQSVNDNTTTIYFPEDSVHVLDAWCTDAVGNESAHDVQLFKVDSTPPELTKTMLGTEDVDYVGDCPPESPEDICFVADNGRGGVNAIVSDPDPTGYGCNVDSSTCAYEVWWTATVQQCKDAEGQGYNDVNGECLLDVGRFDENGTNILFRKDSTHRLVINCKDALGNEMTTDVEVFKVDSTPPVTTKTYGTPTVVKGDYRWITTDTNITLEATDNKVGVDETFYLVTQMQLSEEECSQVCSDREVFSVLDVEVPEFMEYEGPFTIAEDSCHKIQYYSVDKLGNTERVKEQCVFVDTAAPEVVKTIGDPKVIDGELTFISQQTPITLTCTDVKPHPVGDVNLMYRYRVSTDCQDWNAWSSWIDPPVGQGEKTIYFEEDSCHQLEYTCSDGLGNATEVESEIDIVDTQAPEIDINVVGPQIEQACPGDMDGNCLYIDGVTKLVVTAVDPQPHPVNGVTCDWDYKVSEGEKTGQGAEGVTPPFEINFPEQSMHSLKVVCRDALGNDNGLVTEYIVDKTPPVIKKKYLGPYFSDNNGVEWINSLTEIEITAEDPLPHPSGLKSLEYRISLVADNYCTSQEICQDAVGSGEWNDVEGNVNVGEQSCHLIEIKATDNVEKTATHKQCVYVDNTPPTPVKTVGTPHTKWTPGQNGQPGSIFYPWINDACWADVNGIDCWKVPLYTPISLQCNDPLPHPVNNSKVCFNVEWDATDITQKYCRGMEGEIGEDGYCCLSNTTDNFYFGEETEHNLKFYCADALGNKGLVDDEKFKVEGTPFEIELNKKWNLISVPFVLLDSNITTVLESDSENIAGVWTYDAITNQWYVYNPSSPSTSNLDTMEPGNGYWVAAYNPSVLEIAGSLFSPITTPPDKALKAGWNLIGYYGTDGQSVYDGPDHAGRPASCVLYSLGETLLDKGWTALLGYWEPNNPNAWEEYSYPSRMDPGAGYWVNATEDSTYSYSTVCGGFFLN